MTATRKIDEAQTILGRLVTDSGEFQTDLNLFAGIIHEIFTHLLDEYNAKFGFRLKHASLEKFKREARKLGRIDAINFLIWYEKEYRKIKDDPMFDFLMVRDTEKQDIIVRENPEHTKKICGLLLDRIRQMTYHAYENF